LDERLLDDTSRLPGDDGFASLERSGAGAAGGEKG
jgi:hypothetical protein